MNNPDMYPADPEYRKRVLRVSLLGVVLGLLLLGLMIPRLEKAVNFEDPAKALAIIKIVLLVTILIPALLTIYIIRIAVKTIRQRQFPPEGTRVLRDTPMLYDSDAVKRGSILFVLAVLILDACVFAAIIVVKLIGTMV